MDKVKANELIKAFYETYYQRYELVAPNVYPCWKFKEMDIIAIRKSGYVDEIEIKLSRTDFLADFKKTVTIDNGERPRHPEKWPEKNKHEALCEGLNHCNRFSFFMPENLAEKCDIPDHAGLYIFDGKWIKEVKKAPLLHKRKVSLQLKYEIARKLSFRFWQSKNLFN